MYRQNIVCEQAESVEFDNVSFMKQRNTHLCLLQYKWLSSSDGYEEPYNILRNSMISSAMVNGESEQTPLWLECFACMNEYQLTV